MVNSEHIALGKSSYDFIDQEKLYSALVLKQDTHFLDVACGSGAYSVAAAQFIHGEGRITAVDNWKKGIKWLKREALSKGIENIDAYVSDVSRRIPVEDQSIDVCLLATVLHDLIRDKTDHGTMTEIRRVLKDQGRLALVEFKKIDAPPGPRIDIRLSPEEAEDYLLPYSFRIVSTREVGPFNYLSIFKYSCARYQPSFARNDR
jgi:ubiquinone/menaquinone biosynthesis C-methylase UbiE